MISNTYDNVLALDRFRLLQPHLEDNRPLKAVAAAAGIPFRSAQRWVALYRQFGLAGLARKRRIDTGQHREISAKLKEAIEGIALQKPPLPVAMIYRQARRLAQDLGEEQPSYWVVYRWHAFRSFIHRSVSFMSFVPWEPNR